MGEKKMIKRYQSDKMNELWSLKNRFSKFLEVELASLYACLLYTSDAADE